MLTRKKPETINTDLQITGQGETFTLAISFYNRSSKEFADYESTADNSIVKYNLYLVESWESEYPLTEAGLQEAESDRPGLMLAIFNGYLKARAVQLTGN